MRRLLASEQNISNIPVKIKKNTKTRWRLKWLWISFEQSSVGRLKSKEAVVSLTRSVLFSPFPHVQWKCFEIFMRSSSTCRFTFIRPKAKGSRRRPFGRETLFRFSFQFSFDEVSRFFMCYSNLSKKCLRFCADLLVYSLLSLLLNMNSRFNIFCVQCWSRRQCIPLKNRDHHSCGKFLLLLFAYTHEHRSSKAVEWRSPFSSAQTYLS